MEEIISIGGQNQFTLIRRIMQMKGQFVSTGQSRINRSLSIMATEIFVRLTVAAIDANLNTASRRAVAVGNLPRNSVSMFPCMLRLYSRKAEDNQRREQQ
jgi:hypothetical protein